MATDRLAAVSLVFFFIPLISYAAIFLLQFFRQESSTRRLQILSTRTALYLPAYAFWIYLSLVGGPVAYAIFQIPLAVVEGYSFYCFFAMIVSNFGGPRETVAYLKESGELRCCTACCSRDSAAFYRNTHWALFHFVVTRPVLTVLESICLIAVYVDSSRIAKVVGGIVAIINFLLLLNAMLSLILTYDNLYSFCKNLNALPKLVLLKFTVFLIVVEGLIEQFLVDYSTAIPYDHEDSRHSEDFQALRVYAFIVLVELTIISFVSLWAFGIKITPFAPALPESQVAPPEALREKGEEKLSFLQFLCQTCAFCDVFNSITLPADDGLTAPISKSAANDSSHNL